VNWSAGGTSSISGLFKGKFHRVYARSNYNWSNELIVKYGLNKQDGIDIRKQRCNSIQFYFGYRRDTISTWYHSAKFSFNTQFTNGYAYPNTESNLKTLHSAYFMGRVGAENIDKEKKRTFYILLHLNNLSFRSKISKSRCFWCKKRTIGWKSLTEGER
jgi:hypothetical protein